MSDKTKIEWTDATWNPVTGCTKVSAGCDHCYIERTPPFRMEGREFRCPRCGGAGYVEDSDGNRLSYGRVGQFIAGTRCARCSGTGRAGIGDTTGVRMHEDRIATPLNWRKPRKVFVCSMADLFHEAVSSSFIADVFAVMALTPQHTFQVLTKRPARMRALLSSRSFWTAVARRVGERYDAGDGEHPGWAWSGGESAIDYLDNVWLGVSVEDQETANLRITALLNTPAAVRWLSCEPLLGPVSLPICRCLGMGSIAHGRHIPDTVCDECEGSGSPIDWVVVGGESGPGARPMHPSWALSLRDQCVAASVPFLFKQWGEWKPTERLGAGVLDDPREAYAEVVDDGKLQFIEWRRIMCRVGKKAAGRELDGRTWDEYPEVAS